MPPQTQLYLILAAVYGQKASVANQRDVITESLEHPRLNYHTVRDMSRDTPLERAMTRLIVILTALSTLLAACGPGPVTSTLGPDGQPLPQLYRIKERDKAKLQFRMLDSVNALRSASGQLPVALDPQLTAAAATHARDMSVQNRPWHFGSDGSSPIDRVKRVGFTGALVGENISETYETELETLGAWMQKPDTRRILLSEEADSMGFAWFQETNGKIWWTLVMGNAVDPAAALGS